MLKQSEMKAFSQEAGANVAMHGAPGFGIYGVNIFVKTDDAEKAVQLIEDYPGEDVVEIINLRGETTTVYKLVDGRYMDCTNTVYIYDGKDTWTDTNGVEWNQEVI